MKLIFILFALFQLIEAQVVSEKDALKQALVNAGVCAWQIEVAFFSTRKQQNVLISSKCNVFDLMFFV